MTKSADRTVLFLSACAAVFAAAPAFAQSTAAGPTSPAEGASAGANSDIVVTATRREERLQDVPISDTALNTNKLVEKQVVDVTTLAKVVPGLQVKPTINALNITVAIRGVTQLNVNPAQDPPIGMYTDGVYNVISPGANAALVDMERVEVLRGPQGTLFGRNTIGGAINIITAKPKDNFSGYLQADAGDYGAFGITSVINAPLAPGVLDGRLVYQHNRHGGYGTNLFDGTPTNSLQQDYVRGSLRFTPNAQWDALVTTFYNHASGYSAATRLGYVNSPYNTAYPTASGHPGDALSNYVNVGGPQDADSDQDGTFALKQYGVTATITGHLNDAVSVKSITGYTHTDYAQTQDFDGTPYVFVDVVNFPTHADQISEELQAFGDAFDDRLKWIAGAYFFSVDASQISTAAQLPFLKPAAARTYTVSGPYADNQSYSAFAQVTYDLTPKVRLTGGVRYVVDERAVTYRDQSTEFGGLTPGAFYTCSLANAANTTTGALGTSSSACVFKDKVQYSYAPWTVGLDYKPNPDTLLYVKLSQGYRSGAFGPNGPAATAPGGAAMVSSATAVAHDIAALNAFGPVPPESLLSPEIGAKLQFFDRRLTVDAAAYYSKYDNIQNTVNVVSNGVTFSELQNAGDANIWGGELEVTALLGKLSLDGDIGVAEPTYTSKTIPGSGGLPNPYYNTTVVNVAKFNGSITATYPIETRAGILTLSGTYSYRSDETFYTYTAITPAAEVAAVSQKGFGLLDARVSFAFAGAPVTLSLYGQNLTNEIYKVSGSAFPSPVGEAVYFPGAPRTFGGSLKYSF